MRPGEDSARLHADSNKTQIKAGFFTGIWRRIHRPIVERILHLDDTPHRIAFGVFLGFLVGWTPLMGAQIVLYLAVAYLLRANRASGILPVLLTNPITAVPIYVLNWRIGQMILHPGGLGAEIRRQQGEALRSFINNFSPKNVFEAGFWEELGSAFSMFGLELVVGCLVVGAAFGLAGYVATYYGVIAYRRHRQNKAASEPATESPSANDLAA